MLKSENRDVASPGRQSEPRPWLKMLSSSSWLMQPHPKPSIGLFSGASSGQGSALLQNLSE